MNNETIDLVKLLQIIRKRFWVVALSAFLCVGIAALYTFYFVEEKYSADVLLYIWQDTDTSQSDAISYSDMQLFAQLVNDYQELAKSRLVTSMVAEELGLPASSTDYLRDAIKVTNKTNTRHLTIIAEDEDPVFAAALANKVADVFSRVVVEKMGVGHVNIIDPAIVPTTPSSPNKVRNLEIGLILGILIGIGIVFLIEYLDTTVKSIEDVEQLTGFTLLGIIPDFKKTVVHERRHA